MAKRNMKNKENNSLINNTSIGNKKSINNDDKKCCSASNPQAEPKDPENTSEQQEIINSQNTTAKNKKPDSSASEEDSNPIPDPSPSADSMNPEKVLQQQSAHRVKNIFLQVWGFLERLIQLFTFCILAFTLLITKKQAGIMQNQINEMQIDRNESYKAVITANPIQENMLLSCIARGKSGRTVYDTYRLTHFEKLDNMEDYPLYGISPSEKQTFTQLMFANIGPGFATRVKISWDNDNIDRLYQTLLKYDKDASEYLRKEGDYYYFYPSKSDLKTFKESKIKHYTESKFKTTYENIYYSYMLSNREETYSVELPIIYSVLFSEILLHESPDTDQERPSVNLTAEYSDTQGIEYSQTITLTVSNSSLTPINGNSDRHLSYTIEVWHSDPVQK